MKQKKTLLEKAKEIPTRKRGTKTITIEQIEVAIAWMADEITLTQATQVLQYDSPGSCVSRLSLILREAYRNGFIIKNNVP